ncbi:hypothetical protein CFOL_v3_01253 [Cephalotus follicularis]|uniref:CCHC-type domain-containing protein n=1 Tax=Cephalotus follicularis TaxID=3775 RepID=A0A1Q3APP6_CEPFO|nr:hypothetical protein CFOL_v3_01253 [Cephalotus follicularis]
MRCDVVEKDEQLIARYLISLRLEIFDVVQLQQYWTYEDVCRLALKVEKQINTKSNGFRFSNRTLGKEYTSTHGNSTHSKIGPVGTKSVPKQNQASRSNQSNSKARRCFKCQGLGHFA